jgi:O-antigen/teichoic acid export membrane protein
VVSILALTFPATGIGIVPQSLLMRNMEYRKLCVAEVGSALAGTCVAITLAWRGAGVWALVSGSLTLTASSTLLVCILSGWRPAMLFDWQEVRSVLGYSMNLTGFVLVNYFSRNAGHLIVGRYLGPVALGYYQMAYSLLLYPLQALSSVMGRVLFATFSRIQNDQARLRSAFLRYLTVLGALNAPIFLGLMVVAGPLVSVFLGARWLPVVPLITILAPVGILHAVSSPTGQIYLSVGRTDLMFRVGFAAAVVQVAGYLIGVHWGLQGVVLGWAIASIPVSCAGVLISLRLIALPVGALLRKFAPAVACSAAMAVAVLGLRHLMESHGWTQPAALLASTVCLGAVVYGALIVLVRPSFGDDLMQSVLYSGIAPLRRGANWYLGSGVDHPNRGDPSAA